MKLKDAGARIDAVNPRLSAIVQAPAGSGKTEILTQRFLKLLLTVDAPEQVVALTFTRKAAHEMQARILKTLKTNEQVLAHDKTLGWDLLKNPSRLRITTLDSLCQSLTHAIPVQEKHVPYATVTDTPSKLYFKAARACLNYAINTPDYQDAITTLLEHLDNRTDTLLSLLTEQLAKRDQWLAPVYEARMQNKAHLETALQTIESHALEQFKKALPAEYIMPLMALASQIASIENNPDSLRYPLVGITSLSAFNRTEARALASLLLTTQKKFRKSFDHHVGLKRDNTTNTQYKQLKADSKVLLENLQAVDGLLDALLRIQKLPEPTYPKEQWAPLQALLTLLPLLAGHLQLVFQSTQLTDFTGVTQQALDALGHDDAPTDLALYLDYSIKHLLVDEFQDTSIQQFDLIARLTRGFEPGDGRTLFVVGDPMQSIYRFRAAEVGLFLRAQLQGIGGIQLKALYLETNFRSDAHIIQWVNQYFADIFPKIDNLESGAVSFHPAIPANTSSEHDNTPHIYAFECDDAAIEADAIAKRCQTLLTSHPEDSIAILVRSRRQLKAITQALDAHHIPYQGLDTDLTMSLTHVKDIWSVTQALLMPTHRLAWLALLRSPYGGLTLPDLHLIANHAPKDSILMALADSACVEQLSPSGQLRVRFIYPILKKALENRHQDTLVNWIINTLNALHLDMMLTDDTLASLDPFWDKLSQFEQDGLLSERDLFEQDIEKLYTKKTQTAKLQLMTIHKSKGLEFDTVILPGLGKRAPAPDKPLLRWLTLPLETSKPVVLISPLNAAHQDSSALYDYLGALDAEKNKLEQARLLYVAVTRAKKRLYLFDSSTRMSQNTFRDALKDYRFDPIDTELTASALATEYPKRSYLPDTFYTSKIATYAHQTTNPPSVLPELTLARMLGVLTHELLEWICTHHPKTLEEIPWHITTQALDALNLTPVELSAAKTQIQTWITHFFQHPRGQWIMQKHTKEANEYALLVFENNRLNTRIIDRLFEEKGRLWIIDFKTGQHTEEQHIHHEKQLNRYAHYMQAHTTLPIHCGVYYLETTDWVEWAWASRDAITRKVPAIESEN
ncbi:MAG: UvrD-helicase domain-containing protein [Legionellaceae bacterium]|nr:UvrD-helicase domain-containing protein [Legionellaceae bacterium]